GAGGEAVAHDIGDELRPALAPEIAGGLGAVGVGDEPAHRLGALGDAAMDLAGAEDGVALAALAGAAMHMAGRAQLHGDAAGDAAQRAAPADDAGHRLLVHAVL